MGQLIILEEQPESIKIKELSLKLVLNLALRSQQDVGRDHFEPLSVEEWCTFCDLVAGIDKLERLAHVEYPDADNSLRYPKIWYITPWKDSYERYKIVKAKAEAERVARFALVEKMEELTKAVAQHVGFIGAETEYATLIARDIMATQDIELRKKKAIVFGVIL